LTKSFQVWIIIKQCSLCNWLVYIKVFIYLLKKQCFLVKIDKTLKNNKKSLQFSL